MVIGERLWHLRSGKRKNGSSLPRESPCKTIMWFTLHCELNFAKRRHTFLCQPVSQIGYKNGTLLRPFILKYM